MEHCKISKLRNDSSASKLLTKNWIEVSDISSSQDYDNKKLMFKTLMLRSDLCDYSDAYIVVRKNKF